MAAALRVIAEVGSVLVVGASWLVAARAYPSLPARFPTHFGFNGRPDAWGSKKMVWFLPVLSLGMYLFMEMVTVAVSRGGMNPPSAAALAWMNFETLALFLFIEARSIAVARGQADGLGRAFLPVTLAIVLATSWLLVVIAPRAAARHSPPAVPPLSRALSEAFPQRPES